MGASCLLEGWGVSLNDTGIPSGMMRRTRTVIEMVMPRRKTSNYTSEDTCATIQRWFSLSLYNWNLALVVE